jgi:hypothetical protein
MDNNDQNKMRWLRPAMNGDDDAIMRSLFNTLPSTESLSADDLKRMDVARNYMAELFLRGVTLQSFYMDTGLTGFPQDPAQPGMVRNPMLGGESPIYFRLWHVDKDPAVAAKAIQNILASRKAQVQEEYRSCLILQLAIDVDNNVKDQPYALDCGLTPKAVCMEFGLNDVESVFARISQTCAQLSPEAHSKLRIVLGSWAEQEYAHMCKMSLFSKRLPFKMGTEWLLFKNIHSRAGKFAWFWKFVAKRRERHDND